MATIIAYGISAFAVMFLVQIVVARLYRPVSEDKFIILLYTVIPTILALAVMLSQYDNWEGFTTVLLSFLLYFVISSSWVASYPAVYAVCPTLIMSFVIDRNKTGTSVQEIRDLLALKQNSKERLEDAIHDKWVRKNGDKIELTSLGRMFLWFFTTYRRVIGLKLETL